MTTDRVTARREAAVEHDVQEWSDVYASSDRLSRSRLNRYGLFCECGWRVELPKRDVAALRQLTIEHQLTAADEWDRANSYVTIRLDELRSRLLVALGVADGQNLDGFDLGHTAEVMYGPQADAVLSVLRESAEREANR